MLGGAGFLGTWGSARLIGPRIAPLLKQPALVMGACTILLPFLGGSVVGTAILLAIWGAMNTAMSVIWMTWMARNVDDAPEAGGSLMVAGVQASIMLGAVLGGLLLDGISIKAVLAGSVALAVSALALIGTGRGLMKPNQTTAS